ncbi:helix-turn-helix domain-containing protein [Arabiibacter massiliensis]|uniref:helix-turn-helix domain-containing protein n=1 Tax=Arabiibacter massiliensis TaxID=1870985 RepID=UPI00155AACF8|nr:helix-turn-helix domain-containing protein [Arabiibacter massiliensis]
MDREQERAVGRVLECVEERLSERIDLDALAEEAGYSKYHLHRLFAEATGFAVCDYAKRRRITEAARALAAADAPLVEVALAFGYESQQAFSSAFAALYKTSPARFREQGEFYALQLPFELGEGAGAPDAEGGWEVECAEPGDEVAWMELMRAAVDGFPHLDEAGHGAWAAACIAEGRALVVRDGDVLAGALAFDPEAARIDVLAVRPGQRRLEVARALVDAVRAVELPERDVSTTTFRAGDKADTGWRRMLFDLGFEEAEEAWELGYPVQRLVLRAEGGRGDATGEERRRLAETLGLLHAALEEAEGLHERVDGAYREQKRYMVEYRGEIDPAEGFQNELALAEVDRRAAEARTAAERLRKMLDAPYFARVDFAAAGEGVPEAFYLGRFSFSAEGRTVVSDWRSPVAGLFYEHDETGPAAYDAPGGRVEGVLSLKRQLGVERGELVYVADGASGARDEVLARELGRSTDAGMRAIVASIQAEQNRIIRDEEPGTMVIQGVAGSGKTSIALHRVAYMLYRRRGELSSREVAILSPNSVFADYIAGVLPELGEEPIASIDLRGIMERVLGGTARVAPALPGVDGARLERARLKGTVAFARALLAFLERAPEAAFAAEDLAFGQRTLDAAWVEARFRAHGGLPLDERLDLVAASAVYELESTSVGRDRHAVPTRREARRRLADMLRAKDALSLYRLFMAEQGWEDALKVGPKRTVEWEDAAPLALLQGAFSGFEAYDGVKHLVVDEMQDLSPVQHALVARLFRCDRTVLGDCCQAIDQGSGATLDDIAEAYGAARAVRLTRSYRSTSEIVALANRVKPAAALEAVERHGEEPRIVGCADTAEVLARVLEAVEAFRAGGLTTLGILHASDELAARYFELISRDVDARLLTEESATFGEGVSVASVRMAKGLEFDEVVVLDADARFFSGELGRNLLYVAVTRALHRITLLHRGDPAPFLAG